MEQNTNMNTDKREINIKILFAYVFKEWRNILIGGLVFCILFATYKGYKLAKGNSSASTTTTVEASEEQKKSIEETKASIEYLDDYINHSIYANIDPYNEVVTTSTISIVTSTNENISTLLDSTNHANQIVQAYARYVTSEIDYSSLADTLGISEQYLNEVISVKADFDSDTVALKVIGSDKKQTEEISDFIIKVVNADESNIKNQFGEFTPIISKFVTNVITDKEIVAPAPAANSTALFSSNVAMTNALAKKSALETSLKTQQSATIAVSASTASIIKGTLKYGIVGLFCGMFLIILFYILLLINSGKIVDECELKEMYKIKVLSVLPMGFSNEKPSKLDNLIYRKIDSSYGVDTDICLQKAMMNITQYAKGMKTILFIGTGIVSDIKILEESLRKTNGGIAFKLSFDINANAEEINKLKDSDGVIILAQRNATRINELKKTIETVDDWEKPIIGSIVI